jgi:hypothetical protein
VGESENLVGSISGGESHGFFGIGKGGGLSYWNRKYSSDVDF